MGFTLEQLPVDQLCYVLGRIDAFAQTEEYAVAPLQARKSLGNMRRQLLRMLGETPEKASDPLIQLPEGALARIERCAEEGKFGGNVETVAAELLVRALDFLGYA